MPIYIYNKREFVTTEDRKLRAGLSDYSAMACRNPSIVVQKSPAVISTYVSLALCDKTPE